MKRNTAVIHAKQFHDPVHGSHVSPIYQTSTYVLPDFDTAVYLNQHVDEGFVYSRFGSPSVREFEEKIAYLENAEDAIAFASGLGAISMATISQLKQNDHIIFGDVIYGCTFALFTKVFPNFGIEYSIVDTTDISAIKNAMKENTKVIYVETPANPTLKISDIEEIAKVAHENPKTKLIVDSTFASPYLQNPLDLGADMVVHSATKYIGGHGNVTAGVVAGTKVDMDVLRMPYLQCFGAVLDPFGAWQLMNGLKTLGIRMERHCENAMKVAQYLESHPKISRVYYPGLESHKSHEIAKKQMRGFSGMMSADIIGGVDAVRTVMNNVKLFSLATSLGNVDSLIQHSPSMSHFDMTLAQREAVEIFEGQVRISVGIEDADDLIADLEQALSLLD